MNVNQLRKAIKVAKAESKVTYIAIHDSRFLLTSIIASIE